MTFIDKLNNPGEHSLMLEGLVGQLEAVLTIPEQIASSCVAFLGHPHSLQGGTMNNKVVTTMARAFKDLGIPSLRFNFRGVGESEGVYDDGLGESDDMISLVRLWKKELPEAKLICAGFSFGSYVAYRTAAQCASAALITIAPPVHHYNYEEFTPRPSPWLIIQGDADEVVPSSLVIDFAQRFTPPLPIIEFAETGHFFHGKLLDLKEKLLVYIQHQALLS